MLTPIPWKLAEKCRLHIDNARLIRCEKEGADYGAVACVNIGTESEMVQENAEFIVKAVNNHDALVAALEGLLAHAPAHKSIKKDFSYILHLEAARTALAKAKG